MTEYTFTGIAYMRVSDIEDEEARERLILWLYGKTRPVIPGLELQDAVYIWDWERFSAKTISQE